MRRVSTSFPGTMMDATISGTTTLGTTSFDTTTTISYGGYEYDDHEMFAEKCCLANKDKIRLGHVSDGKFLYESSTYVQIILSPIHDPLEANLCCGKVLVVSDISQVTTKPIS